jgi:2-polyprenyl-3-methyl-5-hydroxy-6-metoxy-1,4-benzoquinol methylase
MRTDAAWKEWGKKDPYYGVLSDGKFRKGELDDHMLEFVRSGEEHWRMVRGTCTNLFGGIPEGRAVDFGCGVARVLTPMAKDFRQSVGIDISPDMLTEAQKNAPTSELILSDDTLSRLNGQLDFIHSFIVLQHIPPARGMVFIAILLNRLSPGGMVALHITLKRPSNFAKRIVYFLKHRVPGARLLFNLLQGKPLMEPVMQMNEYDMHRVVRTFEAAGMTDIHILPHPASDTFGVMIFARKSTG